MSSPATPATPRPLHVLHVEDSESDAGLVQRALVRSGFAVEAVRVETADEMRQGLRDRTWDIVIADYHLPQINAMGALQVLRESGLDLPFVVVSGTIGEDIAVAVMRAGAHGVLVNVGGDLRAEGRAPGADGWVIDLDGNKVELWQPPAGQ